VRAASPREDRATRQLICIEKNIMEKLQSVLIVGDRFAEFGALNGAITVSRLSGRYTYEWISQ